jgi:cardiolipin synthase A/B
MDSAAAGPTPTPVTVNTSPFDALAPRFSEGNEVKLLESGGEFFPALLLAIQRARREVYVETYIFQNDPQGLQVAHVLAQAAQRGVQVRLTTDGFGSGDLSEDLRAVLAPAGVQLQVFRPLRRLVFWNRQRLRRLHRKLAVIDGEIAFVGGINIQDDFSDPSHGHLEFPRFDYAVQLRGPIVAPIHVAATRLWWQTSLVNRPVNQARGMFALPEYVSSVVTPVGQVRARFVLRDNFRFRNRIEAAYLKAIFKARREVLIANAYFFPGLQFRQALIDAALRGVRVHLVLQGRPEYVLQHFGARALYEELLLAGVQITEYHRSFLHAKVAVIDDWSTVGSSNIDPFSLLLAREANVVMHDRLFATQLRASILKAAQEGGMPVELTRHRARPWWVRLLNRVAYSLIRVAIALSGAATRY